METNIIVAVFFTLVLHGHAAVIQKYSSSSQSFTDNTNVPNSSGFTSNENSVSTSNETSTINTSDVSQTDDASATHSGHTTNIFSAENITSIVNSSNSDTTSDSNLTTTFLSSATSDHANETNYTDILSTLISSSTDSTNFTSDLDAERSLNSTDTLYETVTRNSNDSIEISTLDSSRLYNKSCLLGYIRFKNNTKSPSYPNLDILNSTTLSDSSISKDILISSASNITNITNSTPLPDTSNSTSLSNRINIYESKNIHSTANVTDISSITNSSTETNTIIFPTSTAISNLQSTGKKSDFIQATNISGTRNINDIQSEYLSNLLSDLVAEKLGNLTQTSNFSSLSLERSPSLVNRANILNSSSSTEFYTMPESNFTNSTDWTSVLDTASSSNSSKTTDIYKLETANDTISTDNTSKIAICTYLLSKFMASNKDTNNSREAFELESAYSSNSSSAEKTTDAINKTETSDNTTLVSTRLSSLNDTKDTTNSSTNKLNSTNFNNNTFIIYATDLKDSENTTEISTMGTTVSSNSTAKSDSSSSTYSLVDIASRNIFTDNSDTTLNTVEKISNATFDVTSTSLPSSSVLTSSFQEDSDNPSWIANKDTTLSIKIEDINTNYSTNTNALTNKPKVIDTATFVITNNNTDTTNTTVTFDTNNNETVITIVRKNVTVTVNDDITNITTIIAITNITSNTNTTDNITKSDIFDVVTTKIFTKATIVTIIMKGNDTTVSTTTVNNTDVIETTFVEDLLNDTINDILKNNSDITTNVRIFDVSNNTINNNSINATTTLTTTNLTSVCTSQGYFADPNSINCTGYVQCIENNDGTYTETILSCPEDSYYNPNTAICDFDYVCITNSPENSGIMNTGNSTSTTNSTYICTAQGYFANPNSINCTGYVECLENIDGSYTETLLLCPDDSYYNPNTTQCDFDYICTTNITLREPDSNTFTCSSSGRFANNTDTTCQTYYDCIKLSNGTYVQLEYTCPGVSVFDPIHKYCTTNYICTSSITISNRYSSDSSNTTKIAKSTENKNWACTTNSTYICTSYGYFADPDSINCTGYVECIENYDGTYTKTVLSCPDDSYYNPNTTVCDFDYVCTTTTTLEESESNTLSCSSPGRFANSTDTTCQTYYYCVELSNGTYVQLKYTCPGGLLYDPTYKYCLPNYVCPSS